MTRFRLLTILMSLLVIGSICHYIPGNNAAHTEAMIISGAPINNGSDDSRRNHSSTTQRSIQDELNALRFIGLATRDALTCKNSIHQWDADRIHESIGVIREYNNFLERLNTYKPGDALSRATINVRRNFTGVMNELLYTAQVGDTLKHDVPVTSSSYDEKKYIVAASRSFQSLDRELNFILHYLISIEAAETFSVFSKCVGDYAMKLLNNIETLRTASDLYSQLPVLQKSLPLPPGNLPMLENEDEVKAYIQRQIYRVHVISSYALPFVRFLTNSEIPQLELSYQNERTVDYWRNTIQELEQFNRHNQQGQALYLHDYLAKVLNKANQFECRSLDFITQPTYGNDLFSAARKQLHTALVAACDA